MSTQYPWDVQWRRSSNSMGTGGQRVEDTMVPSGWQKSSYSTGTGDQCVEVAPMVPVSAAKWQKSSRSTDTGSACVEVAPMLPMSDTEWQKSSRSDSSGGSCVGVADLTAAAVAVRDSKDPDGPKLVFGANAWQAFASQVKGGTLDLA